MCDTEFQTGLGQQRYDSNQDDVICSFAICRVRVNRVIILEWYFIIEDMKESST